MSQTVMQIKRVAYLVEAQLQTFNQVIIHLVFSSNDGGIRKEHLLNNFLSDSCFSSIQAKLCILITITLTKFQKKKNKISSISLQKL